MPAGSNAAIHGVRVLISNTYIKIIIIVIVIDNYVIVIAIGLTVKSVIGCDYRQACA